MEGPDFPYRAAHSALDRRASISGDGTEPRSVFYWDTATTGHHPDYIQLAAAAVAAASGSMVISQQLAATLDATRQRQLLQSERLFPLPSYRPSLLGWREFFRLRSFLKSLSLPAGHDARIVHLQVCEMHLLLGLFALLPWERSWVSRVTGIYFKSKSLIERRQSVGHRIKYWIVHFLVERWMSALLPGTKVGFLTLSMHRHFLGRPKLAQKACYVPDPVPSYLPRGLPAPPRAPSSSSVDNAPFVVCLVGAHAPRKGTDFALDALLRGWRGPRVVRCLVSGPLDDCSQVRQLDLQSNPLVEVVIDDRPIPGVEFGKIIGASDLCLLPYQRHYSPSAVLLVCAYLGTPVLASDIGQVADEVRIYGLGKLFAAGDAASFLKGLRTMIAHPGAPDSSRERYLAEHSPLAFAEAMLNLAGEHEMQP